MAPVSNNMKMIPETQWSGINSSRVVLNPKPKIKPADFTTKYTTFYERLFPRNYQKEYTADIKAAGRALARNVNQRYPLAFNEEDIFRLNHALSIVDPTESAPISTVLAHAHALRHLPEAIFAKNIRENNQTAINQDKFNTEQVIANSKEGINYYQSRLISFSNQVSQLFIDYEKQARKSPKRLQALKDLQEGVKELNKLKQAANSASYNVHNAIETESKTLEKIYRQLIELNDNKDTYSETTAAIKKELLTLADLYYMQGTAYERLSQILQVSPPPTASRSMMNIQNAQEAALYALRDYTIAQKLFKEQETQTVVAEDIMKARLHVKSNVNNLADIVLDESDKEVIKLRREQQAVRKPLAAMEEALKRLNTLQRPVERTYVPVAPVVPVASPTGPSLKELEDQALFYVSSNKPAEALEIYKKIYQQTGSIEVLFTLGQLSTALKQLVAAHYYYSEVLKKDPNNLEAVKLIRQCEWEINRK